MKNIKLLPIISILFTAHSCSDDKLASRILNKNSDNAGVESQNSSDQNSDSAQTQPIAQPGVDNSAVDSGNFRISASCPAELTDNHVIFHGQKEINEFYGQAVNGNRVLGLKSLVQKCIEFGGCVTEEVKRGRIINRVEETATRDTDFSKLTCHVTPEKTAIIPRATLPVDAKKRLFAGISIDHSSLLDEFGSCWSNLHCSFLQPIPPKAKFKAKLNFPVNPPSDVNVVMEPLENSMPRPLNFGFFRREFGNVKEFFDLPIGTSFKLRLQPLEGRFECVSKPEIIRITAEATPIEVDCKF